MYYESLTKKYQLSKTLRNELIPVGKTLENIKKQNLLEKDEKRKSDYVVVKKLMDNYHKIVISESLKGMHLQGVDELFALLSKRDRNSDDEKLIDKTMESLRKQISKRLQSHRNYKSLFNKQLVENILPDYTSNSDEVKAIENFRNFTTYFTNYHKVRENLYSDEAKSSTVAYRLIHENLPKFFGNIAIYKDVLSKKLDLSSIDLSKYGVDEIDSLFSDIGYDYVLTQEQIDIYNLIIGELNSIINLYNQANSKEAGFRKIAKLKELYKMILADREAVFEMDAFASDEEMFDALISFADNFNEFIESADVKEFCETLKASDGKGLYVRNNTDLTSLAVVLDKPWNYFSLNISNDYDMKKSPKKIDEKYEEKKTKELKKDKSYEINWLISIDNVGTVDFGAAYSLKINDQLNEIKNRYELLVKAYHAHNKDKKIKNDDKTIAIIKEYLDSIKELERVIKLISGTTLEADRNELLYGEWNSVISKVTEVDYLYNLVRNHVTKKPFSTEKFKLNFDKATLLDGWDKNKERDNLGLIFIKDNCFYLGIMNKSFNKIIDDAPVCAGNKVYKKMEYKLLPGPNKMLPKVFFSKSRIDEFAPSQKVVENYENKTHIKGDNFKLDDCRNLIDFFKGAINKHEDWSKFEFKFSDTNSYDDISGFYREVEKQGYKITYKEIDESYIDQLVDEGKLYLFQIYNKDFSPYSKGNLNLHTIYFSMLFDERNLNDVVYKLNGQAEIFYRPASVDDSDLVIHKKGEPIKNKNANVAAQKPTTTFEYDIIKNKRYTTDKFQLHIPITMNFGSQLEGNFNAIVNKAIKESEDIRVIGIDRGERNLLYIVVTDNKGKILEQKSLNSIISKYNDITVETDYHKLLNSRESERQSSRRDWKTIENIKELKEGYLSQVVHEIVELVIKYNAIIVLEDLNGGFKNGRKKVEKQVYQKFEKMLIDKLNYLVTDKSREQVNPTKIGGALNAIQLTAPFESFTKMGKQTGIIYYVPAYLTSKIDPTTGFANLFYSKYENESKAKEFFSKFESIKYNTKESYFEFAFDYNNFTYKADGSKTKWTVCSIGDRVEKFRNANKNNSWDDRIVSPTEMLKKLFDANMIDYQSNQNIKDEIVSVEGAAFYKELYHCFNLIMQMRNSTSPNSTVEIESEAMDYIQSPVKNSSGEFYNSLKVKGDLPEDADANGAYNIARKGLWVIDQIKACPDEQLNKVKIAISNKEWLAYAQKDC